MRGHRGTKRGEPEIPNRIFFKIGDVSRIAGVETHVLRFWESEFPTLEPRKTARGHRQYKRKDVEMVLAIKRLLYEEKYTIAGARKALRTRRRRVPEPEGAARPMSREGLREIREQLQQILVLLRPPSGPRQEDQTARVSSASSLETSR